MSDGATPMTVGEAQARLGLMELALRDLVLDFERATGTRITSIDLRRVEITALGSQRSDSALERVTCRAVLLPTTTRPA